MSIRLIASAHLCTLDSFVHYYMSFVHYYMTFIQAGYSQGSHSIMRQQAGTYYTAACVSCKISYMYLSMTVRTERNRLKKKKKNLSATECFRRKITKAIWSISSSRTANFYCFNAKPFKQIWILLLSVYERYSFTNIRILVKRNWA